VSKYIAALCVGNKVVMGLNHGDAFSKLNQDEQFGEIESGFIDPTTGRFFTEEYDFYLKQMYVIRHGESHGQSFHSPLTDAGVHQCVVCANFLETQCIQEFKIYCSPFDRCVQSAKIISEIISIPYQILDCLEKQKDDESSQNFSERVNQSLSIVESKSIIISHADFILQFVAESVGPQFCLEFQNGISNCSVTFIDSRKLIRCVTNKL